MSVSTKRPNERVAAFGIVLYTKYEIDRCRRRRPTVLVRGRGVVFRHYNKSIAKWAGKDYRDGAAVPFE